MPHILIAPDSFKLSLTAHQAAHAIKRGLDHLNPTPTTDLCPIADGGEGTLQTLTTATTSQTHSLQVLNPLNQPIQADWGFLTNNKIAVVEMAQAAGLGLISPSQRNPATTTTHGVGQLIKAALDANPTQLIVAIGGSATNDGGAGMAQALGAKFLDSHHNLIETPMTADLLSAVTQIDLTELDPRLAHTKISVACDVTNPLTGPRGAASIYGPQKGATPNQIPQLDHAMHELTAALQNAGLNIDPNAPGMGAAGGLGFGLVAFCNAQLKRGIDLVLEAVDFNTRLQTADLVITGEGQLDGQSIQGKACIGVAQAAAKQNVPTIALVGSIGQGVENTLNHSLKSYHPICNENITQAQAMAEAGPLLEKLTTKVVSQLLA